MLIIIIHISNINIRMGLTDELEALRQSGSVKSKSADLASATASSSFITPEAEAERRRFKAQQEKQSRLEAKIALHSNNYGGEDDLNSILLNKKLIEEQREKKREAQRNLREWRRKHHDGIGGGGSSKSKTDVAIAMGARSGGGADEEEEEESDEARMNRDALEMLPEHVVRTLKAKYETSNAELALEKALQEEERMHGYGKGRALAKLMEITLEGDEDEIVVDEEEEENVNEKEDNEESQQPPATTTATATTEDEWVKIEGKVDVEVKEEGSDLKEHPDEEEVQDENNNGAMGKKVAVAVGVAAAVAAAAVAVVAATSTTTTAPEPVEEQVEKVREKIEHLSIDEVGGGEDDEEVVAEERLHASPPDGDDDRSSTTGGVVVNVDNDSGTDGNSGVNNTTEETKERTPSFNDNETTTTTTTLSAKNYDMQIELTKRFYNLHSQEYIDHTSNKTNTTDAATTTVTTMDSKNLSSSSSSHRDTFIEYIRQQHQQQLMDNSTNNDCINTTSTLSLLLLDLGCGYGRDTHHFTSTLGHRVLGVDFSIEMLHHAKRMAPLAHYLNMDIRQFATKKKNSSQDYNPHPPLLVDQSLDGIWANSSLLHVPKCDMVPVLQGLYDAIKVDGVLFMSLKVRNNVDSSSSAADDDEEEVFEIDKRYTARNTNILPGKEGATEEEMPRDENAQVVGTDEDDTRRKFYSYYTMEEVRDLVIKSGWTILEMKEEDHRGISEYVTHSKLYVFATRKNE